MNKIKKIFTSFGVFFTSVASKVLAVGEIEMKYGIIDPRMYEPKYETKLTTGTNGYNYNLTN